MRPPASSTRCCAIEAGRHVVMVNVEADALVGPLLARRAQAAGVVYTLAYGDQPALICELVEWARLSGFEVVCAGKGTKHLPAYHEVTPASVWEHYGLPPEQTAGLNAQMFCSFLDGTKSAVEMAAVANATGLVPQARGLGFPACGTGELAARLRPAGDGGVLDRSGTLEVVSSLHPTARPCPATCAGACTSRSPPPTATSPARSPPTASRPRGDGRVAALWRPSHLVGLELGVSVARAVLAGEPTGVAREPRSPRSRVAPSATCARARRSTARAASTFTASCRRRRRHAAEDALPMGLARGARSRARRRARREVARADVEFAASGAAAAATRSCARVQLASADLIWRRADTHLS